MIPQLREKDSDWRTAGLCLHEILNVLATYQRRGLLTLEQCRELLKSANRFLTVAQCEVDMEASLTLAAKYGITGYDAQYVALAQNPAIPLDYRRPQTSSSSARSRNFNAWNPYA